MVVACLFSGGKDSTLALHKAYYNGIKTDLLITMNPNNDYSYMFHKPNIEFTKLQAESLGIEQVISNTEGERDKELDDLENIIGSYKIDKLITGAIMSKYQKDRVDAICEKFNVTDYSPLWGIDPLSELNELSDNFKAIITKVSAEGMDKSLLGKVINKDIINRLIEINKKYQINMLFEGGEAESFVLDAPLFKKRIIIDKANIREDGSNGEYIIEKAHLEDKDSKIER